MVRAQPVEGHVFCTPAQPVKNSDAAAVTTSTRLSSPETQAATDADRQHANGQRQAARMLPASNEGQADEDIDDIQQRLANLKKELAEQPNAENLRKQVLELLRSWADEADEDEMTEEEAEERAIADVLLGAMNEESNRKRGFFVDPKHAAEHPDKFFTEPISAHDFEGSEAWASDHEECLKALGKFKEKWTGQLLPKLGTEVSDAEEMSDQQWRRAMLWLLFDATLVAS